jgi:hypothetical protein
MTDLIPAATRYASAWSEVNQRINARTQFNIAHLATIMVAAGAFLNAHDPSERWLPAFLMPIISAIFVAWYRHNEGIIAALSLYCSYFEHRDYEENKSTAPSWFFRRTAPRISDEDGIQQITLTHRRWSDRATALICIASPVFVIIDFYGQYMLYNRSDSSIKGEFPTGIMIESLYLSWCVAWSLFLSWVVLGLSDMRANVLQNGRYNSETGLWNIPR